MGDTVASPRHFSPDDDDDDCVLCTPIVLDVDRDVFSVATSLLLHSNISLSSRRSPQAYENRTRPGNGHPHANGGPANRGPANGNLVICQMAIWLGPFFRLGHKKIIEEEDLYPVLPEDRSGTLGEDLQRRWDEECLKASKKQRDPSFAKAIIRCYRKSYAWLGLITFIVEVIRIIQPVLLGKLLEYFEAYQYDDALDPKPAYLYATGISLSVLTLMVILHLFLFKLQSNGMRIRVALSHMIYKKALRLSSSATAQTTTGQIVNLLSTDVNKFDELSIFLHYLWVGPLNVVVVVALLWSVIGPSCLAGCVVLLFQMPLQSLSGKLFSKFSREMAVLTDSRILTMNEVVSGIRIIKMYAWEKPFAALVSAVRQEEVSKVMNGSYLRAFNMAFSFSASKLIVFITFSIYVTLGNIITASRVFYTVALYNSLRRTATLFFPAAIEKLFECRVSVQRIQTFLMLEDVKTQHAVLNKDQEPSVDIQDLICYWDTNQDMPSLQNISLTVKAQQLLAVIGPVGAGKSSLLSAILGELPHDKGVLKVKGQLTYASQQPWVFPGTIRSNILFGKEMNPSKYDHVIWACALKRDMELLQDGDMTLIGDRGATLSGGQKARVNLARAVYQDADIYLLDDPLSAVDAEVGRHLFE
ncbi:hypothetical protein NHX12_015129, partial [Muraenolepis orangiensis]